MKQTMTLTRKQVRETSIGKSISAYVVLRNDGRHVATIQAAFLDSGNVMVDVWGPHSLEHQGKAGGYGYDKFTAALSGAEIDGNVIYDHSVGNYETDVTPKYPELSSLMARYNNSFDNKSIDWQEKAKSIGASFANWKDGKYHSLYFISGLERLTALGYKVIKAI